MTPGTRHSERRASEGLCEACKCALSCACPSEDGDFCVFLSRGHLGLFATYLTYDPSIIEKVPCKVETNLHIAAFGYNIL